MKQPAESIKDFFEFFAFGVCERLGDLLKIQSSRIRLFFIYTSFITLGSPLLLYLIMAFVLNLRKMIKGNRGSLWDM
jgi:phage shock protein PspC (stress-responsive transcriptional regulator)